MRASIYSIPVPCCLARPISKSFMMLTCKNNISNQRNNAISPLDRLLCTRLLEKACPFIRIKKLSFEVWSEVWIGEVRRVVLFHERNICGLLAALPVLPEPLGSKAWNGIDAPMHKYPELCLIIPVWQWPLIK